MTRIRPKVLLIDDEPDVRFAVSLLLRLRGMDVIEAESGENGIVLARTACPTLIVSDIRLSGMDGFAMYDHLRKSPETEKIPIIFITGWADTWKVSDHIKQGGTVIGKPFNIQILMAAVTASLSSKIDSPRA